MPIVAKSKTAGGIQTQNHVKHIKWSFLMADRRYLQLIYNYTKTQGQMFDRVLNTPLYFCEISRKVRPLLVDCSFMVIRCIRTWELYFTALELIITSKFWKKNKKIIKDILLV